MRQTTAILHPGIHRIRMGKIELPKRWFGWIGVVFLSAFILYPVLMLSALASGGRIGIINVTGNSMADVFPWGSQVVVMPFGVKDNDYVVAWVNGCDQPEEKDDREAGLVVKQLDQGKLRSTCTDASYSQFDIRGKVVAYLPIQVVCRLLNKGAQNPSPGFKEPTLAEKNGIKLKMSAEKTVWDKKVVLYSELRAKEQIVPYVARVKTVGTAAEITYTLPSRYRITSFSVALNSVEPVYWEFYIGEGNLVAGRSQLPGTKLTFPVIAEGDQVKLAIQIGSSKLSAGDIVGNVKVTIKGSV